MNTHIPTVVLPSAAAEMLMTLTAVGQLERGTLEVGDAFVERLGHSAGEALTRRTTALGGEGSYVWVKLLPMAVADPQSTSVGGMIDHIQAVSPEEVMRHVCGVFDPGFQDEVPPDVMEAALAGWSWARERVRKAQRLPFPSRLVFGQAGHHVAELVELLADWDRSVWSRSDHLMMPAIIRDAERKRRRQDAMTPEGFLVAATGGVTWSRLPDVSEIVLAPSYVLRPWTAHTQTPSRLVIAYPIDDESLGPETDTALRRLGRVIRARRGRHRPALVRALGAEELTLAQLSARLRIEPAELLPDLVSLRAVGMAVVDAVTHRYRLRRGDLHGFGQLVSTADAMVTPAVRRSVGLA